MAWIDGHQPHAHWADAADPWELLWLRMDGTRLVGLRDFLGAVESPVFRVEEPHDVKKCFLDVLKLMSEITPDRGASKTLAA